VKQLGKYRIITNLGQGGTSEVMLAMASGPSGFTKLAVLKAIRDDDPEVVSALVDEARITALLNHPNIVQTLEVCLEDEICYLALEFLDGKPLAALKGLSRELRYVAIVDALAGLHHAHWLTDYDGTPLRIVHRDVSPKNIFVTYDGQVKLVDFGTAKATCRSVDTRVGVVRGKVQYMAPERVLDDVVDRRADIFSIGVLLWEIATGKSFWGDKSDIEIVHALSKGDYNPSARAVDPSVPHELDSIIRQALDHSPDRRYGTAAQLKFELEAFLGDEILELRKQLGPRVGDMFKEERKQLRTVIEKAGVASAAGVPKKPSRPSLAAAVLPSAQKLPPAAKRRPEGTEYSMLGFIPRKRRFGVGALVGAALMFAATAGIHVLDADKLAKRFGHEVSPDSLPLVMGSSGVVKAEPISEMPVAKEAAVKEAPPAEKVAHTARPRRGPATLEAGTVVPAFEAPSPAEDRARIDTKDPW
jgi:serine/threonine protein kinase